MRKRRASAAGRCLASYVRRFIASSLADGEPTVARAAEAAGMSVRTLQRRLLDADLTYHQLLNEVRLVTAMRLLIGPEMSVAEIALALGYSDSAHFSRAFKRLTGEAPFALGQRLRRACRRRREAVGHRPPCTCNRHCE